MNSHTYWSRLPGFYKLDAHERRKALALFLTSPDSSGPIDFDDQLSLDAADCLSENVIGTFDLPFSVATNLVVDGQPVIVPMVTEEPSIVAACSKMAKIIGSHQGFITEVSQALMKGQIQFYSVRDVDKAIYLFERHRPDLLAQAQSLCPKLKQRGGGVVDIACKKILSPLGPMVIVEFVVDVVDAMGANIVNTIAEALAPKLVDIVDGSLGISILSNLCDQRMAKASCSIPFAALAADGAYDAGKEIALKMAYAHAFAESDPYRACTHNKGILNGMDAVALACGNDTRALEAGAHAYAAKSGYKPLTSLHFNLESGVLEATLALPLAVGVVGGISAIHPKVKLAYRILGPFAQSSKKLASVMVSVGLSQCLAALYALCNEGIQKGHMKLHNKKQISRNLP